ncbi:MAG: NUDIX domain-containing protein [Clostridiales bacterium]|nr:NUDIX domain-containing protein [Clostridiales bacterium]
MSKIIIEYYQINELADKLKFVVVPSKYNGKWVFVRHQGRTTWEFPGGHIEEGELPDDAASRELKEESGAVHFNIKPLCNYSVDRAGKVNYGRIYFANIEEMGDCRAFEMDEVITAEQLPEKLTYPAIMKSIIERIIGMEELNE